MAINDRPLILLCPGGGYTRTSDREAEPMALKFLAMGYHAAVRYSCAPAEYPYFLKERLTASSSCGSAEKSGISRSPQDRSGRLFCGRTPLAARPWNCSGMKFSGEGRTFGIRA